MAEEHQSFYFFYLENIPRISEDGIDLVLFSPIDLLPCMIEEQFFASQIIEQIPATLMTMFSVFLINLRRRKGKSFIH